MGYFCPDFVSKDEENVLALNESIKANPDFRCNMQEECFARGNEGKCSNCIVSFRAGVDRSEFFNSRARWITFKKKTKKLFGMGR